MRNKLCIALILLGSLSYAQTFKVYLKITDDEKDNFNTLKYNINIYNCTKDSSYDYIAPSNFVLLFDYESFYKIRISSFSTNSHEYFLSNYGPEKNCLMNLIIPLRTDTEETVKKIIYYSKQQNRYFIDRL